MGGGNGTVTDVAGEPLSEESGFPRTPSAKTFDSAQPPVVVSTTTGGCASGLRKEVEANGFCGEPAFWRKPVPRTPPAKTFNSKKRTTACIGEIPTRNLRVQGQRNGSSTATEQASAFAKTTADKRPAAGRLTVTGAQA